LSEIYYDIASCGLNNPGFPWLTQDFWKICELGLFPYGNANRTRNGSSWSFTCQHGPRECQGNIIETCAIKLYDKYTQALPFIICLELNSTNWNASGQLCSSRFGMDWNRVYTCSVSEQGNSWENEMAINTESLSPKHTYVPWIVVNYSHNTNTENAVLANMVNYVCTHYNGTERIDACRRTEVEMNMEMEIVSA
jgi:interferon gamma-inducible protein 30